MTLKACIVCGKPYANRGSRCDLHTIPARTGTYSRNAAKVRATALVCRTCGDGPRLVDPFVAEHVVPRGYGGSDDISNLRAAHRSCNGRKGAQLGNASGLYQGGRS